ncbi:hypothetical protein P4I14_22145, partial [Escherichia coli]
MPDATLARLIMPTNHIAHFNKLSFIPYSSTSAIIDFHLNHHLMGNDSNLLIVFYVQIMPDDFVMQLHR